MNSRDLKEMTPFYTKLGLLITLVILCLACLFIPETKPKPYKLKAAIPIRTIELPPQLQQLKEPPPPPKPMMPVAAKTDEEVEASTIDRTVFEESWKKPPELKATVYEFWAVEVKPKLEYYIEPEYPELARKAEIEGTVFLEVIVDTTGRVVDIKVTKSLHELCDQSAINAARKWIFSPAKQRDRPVPVRVQVPVRFVLEK
ncbi:MAG: TonB family protein [bacterium]|nr:TonB family protein [bacterium]